MNLGIILYSQTGNTRQAAQVLQDVLRNQGHHVTMEEIEVEEAAPKPGAAPVFKTTPDPRKYDALVFAGQVQAFTLSIAMKGYMDYLQSLGEGSLQGKPAAVLLTKHLRNRWTGANSAVKKIKKVLQATGANYLGDQVIFWSSKSLEQDIARAADKLLTLFQEG